MLHTNTNCKIVKDVKNSMYGMMLLKNTTENTKNENVLRNNFQKTVEIKFEDSHPYRAELVQNMPKLDF